MSQVYVSDMTKVDEELLAKARQMPDDVWVFAEFDVSRNIDWLFLRPCDNGRTVAIVVELKRCGAALRGEFNGPWERDNGAGAWEPLPINGRDANPFRQAVGAATALREWLWNNQCLYRRNATPLPCAEFRVWPDLLILSPPGVTHRLPLRPPTNYGRVWNGIDDCLAHIMNWRPDLGLPISQWEIVELAAALGLRRLPSGQEESQAEPAPIGQTAPAMPDVAALLARIEQMEERLYILEALRPPGLVALPQPGVTASPGVPVRMFGAR